jgi:hypothetical protein
MSRHPAHDLDVADRDEVELAADALDERPGPDEFEPADFDDVRLGITGGFFPGIEHPADDDWGCF